TARSSGQHQNVSVVEERFNADSVCDWMPRRYSPDVTVEEFLKQDVRLPSPPSIAVRIIDVVKHDDFSFNQLASIIQSDPALAGRILSVANSSLYALPRKVSTIEMAVAVLGANTLKNIALSFTLPQVFQGSRAERFDFDHFWRRSITAAVAAQLLSQNAG